MDRGCRAPRSAVRPPGNPEYRSGGEGLTRWTLDDIFRQAVLCTSSLVCPRLSSIINGFLGVMPDYGGLVRNNDLIRSEAEADGFLQVGIRY